jgi:outer membrane receptor protein involved in Fe transport
MKCLRNGPVAKILLALAFGALSAAGQVSLPDLTVTATRTPEEAGHVPFSLTVLDGDTLRQAPTVTLDDALRSIPGFSLFRRSDSLTANPTTQGVSLRGLGPNGASRSLVLLDGVPLNDPFGGWVAWTKVPREALAGAEILRGGGASAWGNAALGGVVQLTTEDPTARDNRFTASYGSFSTRSAELEFSQPIGHGTLQLLGRGFATDGFSLVAPEDRGPIDIAAWNRHDWLAARWQQPVGADAQLLVTARTYDEHRNNGTPYQQNNSRENFVSTVLNARPSRNFSWTATAYAQDQDFSSTFSSVNAARTAETPANDQFAVPATALGAAWQGVWTGENDAHTSAGADFREVRGETRENYSYSNGDFTRQRIAGGTQDFAGIFALHQRPLGDGWSTELGARLDYWRDSDGRRHETSLINGAVLRDDHYADADGTEFSPSAGLVWKPAADWRVHAAGQYSFRQPTLNELYRPFRVGSVITEANPDLRTEHATSTELGAEYTHGTVTLGATVFWNDLRDAVANVTIAQGPGTFPIFGFIPAGTTGQQRLNLDRTRVQGVELSAKWQPAASFALKADYLGNDATIREASVEPALAGNRLAQVPRQSAVLGAEWRPLAGLTLTPRVRWLGRQFEDNENTLVLGEALVVDLGAAYTFARRCEIFLTIENLTDARIETGRSADGTVNAGAPRLFLGGFRCGW